MSKFIQNGNGKWSKIITPCQVASIPRRNSTEPIEQKTYDSAQWDTGATITLISHRVVAELGLKHIRYTSISGIDNKPTKARTYIVNLKFPNEVEARYVEVAEAPLLFVDLLIGMDIIAEGDFHYSIANGISSFTFELDY